MSDWGYKLKCYLTPLWYWKLLVWLDDIHKFKAVRVESSQRAGYPFRTSLIKHLLYVHLGIKR